MAEFVEKNLEQLLPVFEHLQAVELLPAKDVTELIKECRRYEYQLAKRTKIAKDFMTYADYLAEVILDIKKRRNSMGITSRYDKIDKPLKYKCAFIRRLCSERFRKVEYFRKEIDFARDANMLGTCSQAYTRFLQFHGNNPRHHEEAGRFEFYENKSTDNARTIFQTALRKFPEDVALWTVLFEMEIKYVAYLKNRNEKLTTELADGNNRKRKAEEQSNDVGLNDDIMSLKLAEIVINEGLKSVPDKFRSELLHKLWLVATEHRPTSDKIVNILEEALKTNQPVLEVMEKKETKTALDERSLQFWEELVDAAIETGDVKKIEKVFQRSFSRAPPQVAAELKTIRLNVMSELNDDAEVYRQSYKQMSKVLPTSLSLHLKLVELEMQRQKPDEKLIGMAFENALIEFGRDSVDCWIKYLQFLLKSAPQRVGSLNARAMVNLSADKAEEFQERWTQLMMC